MLSPSLFSLHSKGKGIEKLSSLPNLVQGFSQGDQQEWLNFIIEAAGVNEQIDNLEQVRLVGKHRDFAIFRPNFH